MPRATVQLVTKWYFGGIAGNELQMLERMRKNQLDAVLSGGMMCMKLSPSMRVLRLLGLFQSRAEASYVARPVARHHRPRVRARPASTTSARRRSGPT